MFQKIYLATRSTQRTVRRNGNSVQVTRVFIMVLLDTAVGQIPDLKQQTRLLLKLGEKNIMEKLKDQAREECIFQLQIINHKIFHLSLSVKIITRSLSTE